MSFSDLDTSVSYNGNDSDDTFAINFYYKEGQTDDLAIKAYLIADDTETTVPAGSWDETNYPDTEYIFDDPLPSTIRITLYRLTETGQPTNLNGNVYGNARPSIETMVDRVAQQVQENRAALENADLMDYFVSNSGFFVDAVADAEAAQAAAEAAQAAAETAQTGAETAETNAETAQTAAETAQTAAETAQTAAETAQTAAETAETNAETAQTAAEGAQSAAELAQSEAEDARDMSQFWAFLDKYSNVVPVTVADSPVTVADDTLYIADTSGGDITFNLPTSTGKAAGWKAGFLKYEDDTNQMIVVPDGTDTINGNNGNETSEYIGVGMLVYFDSGINFIREYFTTGNEPTATGLGGGGILNVHEQLIADTEQITLNPDYLQQSLKVKGQGGAATTDTDVFFTEPPNGTVVILIGTSDSEPLTIPYADVDGGCLLNGDCTLRANHLLHLLYDSTLKRYFEIGRRN